MIAAIRPSGGPNVDPLFDHITIHLTDDLGASSSVTVTANRYYDALRALGARGMWSGAIPRGGLRFPLANAEDFDWRLLAARPFVDRDGNACLYARGHVWKRRDLLPNEKKNLPAAIKYSRGAKPTDDPTIIEGEEGTNFRYVTFISFSGLGNKIDRYALPNGGGA
jgi:hypothetical protein